MGNDGRDQIAANIAVHDRVAHIYDRDHGEIFNQIEQSRLADALLRAKKLIQTESDLYTALDFGCGSGNLTRHLLELNFRVTASDVSSKFLELVKGRFNGFPIATHRLNGVDLVGIPDESFDLISVYSVLHHIPDYLGAVRELGRVCKRGGVILIDHEPTENFWQNDPLLKEYNRSSKPLDLKKFLVPSNYYHKIWRLFNSRHTNEGDIHVWPDDHVEWSNIKALLSKDGFEVVHVDDYLLYRRGYNLTQYQSYRERCVDMRCMMLRRT